MSKTLSKYITAFHYFDKTLCIISAASGTVFIVSSATVINTPVAIIRTSLSLVFSISNRIAKKLLKTIRKTEKTQ